MVGSIDDGIYQSNTNCIVIPAGDTTFHANVHAQKDKISTDCEAY